MDTERCNLYHLAHVKSFWLVEYVLITAATYSFYDVRSVYSSSPNILAYPRQW
jgi:hypothetical protein